jgi:hypothetical protein
VYCVKALTKSKEFTTKYGIWIWSNGHGQTEDDPKR